MIIIINCPQAVQAEKYKDKIFGFFCTSLQRRANCMVLQLFPDNTKFCIIISYIKIIF